MRYFIRYVPKSYNIFMIFPNIDTPHKICFQIYGLGIGNGICFHYLEECIDFFN